MWIEWVRQDQARMIREQKESQLGWILAVRGNVGVDEGREAPGARHPGPREPLLLLYLQQYVRNCHHPLTMDQRAHGGREGCLGSVP